MKLVDITQQAVVNIWNAAARFHNALLVRADARWVAKGEVFQEEAGLTRERFFISKK